MNWRVISFLLFGSILTFGEAIQSSPDESSARVGESVNPAPLPDSVIVTANRFGATREKTAWPVSVINRERLTAAADLAAVLDGSAGLDIRQTAGVGSLTTLSNWGSFNRHMLLLYNGRVVRDYSLGGFNLSDYSGDEFDAVELVKGPQSAWYGSDAVGGVVNLISSSALANRKRVSLGIGSHNRQQYRIDLSRRFGNVGTGIAAAWEEADNKRSNSGTERLMLGLQSNYLSGDGRQSVSLSGRYYRDSVGVPGPVPDQAFIPAYGTTEVSSVYDHQKDGHGSVDLQYRLTTSKRDELQIDLFWENKLLDYFYLYSYGFGYRVEDPSPRPNDSLNAFDSVDVHTRNLYDKHSSGLSARYLRRTGQQTISGGIDLLRGSLRSTARDTSDATTTSGPYTGTTYSYDSFGFWSSAQTQYDIWQAYSADILRERLRADFSGRLQLVTGRKMQPSYNIGTSYTLAENWQIKIAYGYAFRLPSLADQFIEDAFTAGNPRLSPERSQTFATTIACSNQSARLSAELTGYHQRTDSLIQYRYDPATFKSIPLNVDKFRSIGLDASVRWVASQSLSADAEVVWQDAQQTVPTRAGLVRANHVPKMKARLGVTMRRMDNVSLTVSAVQTSSRRLILFDNAEKLLRDALNLSASVSYQATKQIRFIGMADDLLDQRRANQFGFTMTDGDYPGQGRRFGLKAIVSVD